MPTIYLDNASTSWPKPPSVATAMARFLTDGAASPGRGAFAMARENGQIVEHLRQSLARWVGCDDPNRIVLTAHTTAALNLALFGLLACDQSGHHRAKADSPSHVVITVLEHNAILRPLAHLEAQGLVEVTEVGCDADGFVDARDVLDAVTDRTEAVCLCAASNVIGTIQPVAEIGRGLRRMGSDALFVVDSAQSAGLIPIDVRDECIDLLAVAGHKSLLGPPGTGALYVGERAFAEPGDPANRLHPIMFGGTGVESFSPLMPADLPGRFEPGTPNVVGIVGLLAALEDESRPTPEVALAHEQELVQMILDGLAEIEPVHVLGPRDADRRVGVVSFNIDGYDPAELGVVLDQSFGIGVRVGLHCAPGAHRAMGTLKGTGGGAVRVSPGPYTTHEEIQACIEAVEQLAGVADLEDHGASTGVGGKGGRGGGG